ncbi:ribose-phosphate pyrophosphokinase [bacterium]|nr:ribose-phosphate pyrophosphokinase [bacterium]
MNGNDMKIFSGLGNLELAEQIADYLGMPLGKTKITRFNDGEISVKYDENIRGTDVFIVQPTCPPGDRLIELLLLIDASRRASAKRITAVIPYFGYARQDRKDQPRVAISSKLMANLITVAGADRMLTMDLHSASIQGFFDIPSDHLYSSTLFVDRLQRIDLTDPVVVAPDIGSSKRAGAYATRLNADLAVVDKKRSGPGKIADMTLIGNVSGRDVIMIDDMVDTAGTLCRAAEIIADAGANKIFAACTHPILSKDAVQRIQDSKISRIFVTDTIQVPQEKRFKKLEIISSAPLFGEAIRRIHNEESISSLF